MGGVVVVAVANVLLLLLFLGVGEVCVCVCGFNKQLFFVCVCVRVGGLGGGREKTIYFAEQTKFCQFSGCLKAVAVWEPD